MKPGTGKLYERQSVTEAMNLWEGAENTDKPIGTDKKGNITVLYGSTLDRFSKPSAHHDAAKQCLLDKIKTESGPFLGIKNDVFAQVMKTSLPSIERFVNDGKLGNLPTEWQAFQNSQNPPAQLPREIELKRHAQTEMIAEILPPGMKVDIRDGSISLFTHQFSEASQERLLKKMELIADEKINKTLPLSNQFILDANRDDTYRIQTPEPAEISDEASPSHNSKPVRQALIRSSQLNPHGSEVVKNLYDFCDGDLSMMQTLSCLLCQSSINKMDDEDAQEMVGPSGFRPIFNAISRNTANLTIFELSRDANGEIILGLKLLVKARMITSGQPGEDWSFEPGPNNEIATENNFNRRTSFVMAMNPSDLRNGLILPIIRRPPETSYVFDFDWKRIDKN